MSDAAPERMMKVVSGYAARALVLEICLDELVSAIGRGGSLPAALRSAADGHWSHDEEVASKLRSWANQIGSGPGSAAEG